MNKIEYITLRELSKRLNVHPTTLWRGQKINSTFKTVILSKRTLYVWSDGEPVLNEKGE